MKKIDVCSMARRPRDSRSGQALIIAVFLGLVLLLCIPIVVFLNNVGTRHQSSMEKKSKGRSVADEGLADAARTFSVNENVWEQALKATTNWTTFTNACNGTLATAPTAPSGGRFTLTCTRNPALAPNLQTHQTAVTATAWLPGHNGVMAPTAARQAYFSKRTLAASLATGLNASAALSLVNPPKRPISPQNGALEVHWGPIVILSTTTWDMDDPLNGFTVSGTRVLGYPRKFSNGGITGRGVIDPASPFYRSPLADADSKTTDDKEYWAHAALNIPPVINMEQYEKDARTTGNIPPGIDCGGCPQFDGYVDLPLGVDATISPAFMGTHADDTIFIRGDVIFAGPSATINLSNGSLIVAKRADGSGGNLTLDTSTPLTGNSSVRVPSTADREYPYPDPTGTPPGWPWPCKANWTASGGAGGPCSIPAVHFRGFIAVENNLIIRAGSNWKIYGAISVGDRTQGTGELIIDPGGSLLLYYDDGVNHRIKTHTTELQADLIRDVTAR